MVGMSLPCIRIITAPCQVTEGAVDMCLSWILEKKRGYIRLSEQYGISCRKPSFFSKTLDLEHRTEQIHLRHLPIYAKIGFLRRDIQKQRDKHACWVYIRQIIKMHCMVTLLYNLQHDTKVTRQMIKKLHPCCLSPMHKAYKIMAILILQQITAATLAAIRNDPKNYLVHCILVHGEHF